EEELLAVRGTQHQAIAVAGDRHHAQFGHETSWVVPLLDVVTSVARASVVREDATPVRRNTLRGALPVRVTAVWTGRRSRP
ncbi:MAG TPA: hypothetical protein VFU74_19260, partial [Actinocrinis sp.]|nr:hypothetical protein [Actinocrinis sp.]